MSLVSLTEEYEMSDKTKEYPYEVTIRISDSDPSNAFVIIWRAFDRFGLNVREGKTMNFGEIKLCFKNEQDAVMARLMF